MHTGELATIQRDCDAILIPYGEKITLKKGEEVVITQALGGSYTVMVLGRLARIDGQDADALGKELAGPESTEPELAAGEKPDESLIWDQLRKCYDPEIPVNIVDLGLIYDLAIAPVEGGAGHRVVIKMTLTAPGCGMGTSIAEDVKQGVLTVPGVANANVELVWEPTWNQSMMSDAAQLQLGMM